MNLFKAIDARRDELVELSRALIRFPTVNPPGEAYGPCARVHRRSAAGPRVPRRLCARRGYAGRHERYPRINVIARREGASPGPCVHFNGHIDVVQSGAGWTLDPFAAEVRQGKVYGRGACDMKGGLAASIIAVEALIDWEPALPGTLEISGTVDEESGGYGGVHYLAERGWFSPPRVDHVIIPEPLNVDRVCIGHRGVWWAEIETHGRMAHGSMPFLGDCAVRHMNAVLERFERELYPRLAARRTDMPVVPSGARHSTMNINSIHGGQAEEPAISRRLACPIPAAWSSIAACSSKRTWRVSRARCASCWSGWSRSGRGSVTACATFSRYGRPWRTATVRSRACTAAAMRRVMGREPEFICSPGTYDQKHIDRVGRLRDCIAYGPGILDLAHQPDEYVVIDDMVDSAKVMALAARSLLIGTRMRIRAAV